MRKGARGKQKFRRGQEGRASKLWQEMDGLGTAGVSNMEKKAGEMPGSEAASCLILV